MAKPKIIFVCQNCGQNSPKWVGRCSACNEWNTFVEEAQERIVPKTGKETKPVPLPEIEASAGVRAHTRVGEFDRVLGGGAVPGSVTLIGGDPGIGKSTLLMQALYGLAQSGKALYVTGEESMQQVRLRAERLGALTDQVSVLAETNLEAILSAVREEKPDFICIDSIQTLATDALPSAAGSVGQIRETASKLLEYTKKAGCSLFLIGHVTKEGTLAGPRVLEHMVDTVLYFEGERGHPFRILRAVKNRFGSTNEIGVFEMKEAGLRAVDNPSELFLAERPADTAGSVVVPTVEGTRPILVEVQALVSPAIYGNARRSAMGFDLNRVNLLAAVLEKKGGLQLVGQDIFVNIAGGVKVMEPAADLGVALAIASSFQDKPIDNSAIILGELGLTGEVRGVAQIEQRLHEAHKLGFRMAVIPEVNVRRLERKSPIELVGVRTIYEALDKYPVAEGRKKFV